MKEFKGTPSPWFVGAYGGSGRIGWFIGANPERDGCDYVIKSPNNMTEIDAKLIAAAPELLEALQDALHAYDKHDEDPQWDFARSAINKALGK